MKKSFLVISVLLLLAAVSCRGERDTSARASRMDASRLNIGTYILQPYARSEAHISDLADCGIDFVICMENDRAALDLFSKYGIGAIVTGVVPGWWGGDGNNAGTLREKHPLAEYEAAAAAFEDHPAIWGIDIGLLGGLLGGWLLGKLGADGAFWSQWYGQIVCALIGAVILLLIWNWLKKLFK